MRINKSLITYIPTSGAGSGTVTSVALSATMPTGLTASISGSPITSSGTLGLTLSFTAGYSIPTTVKQSNWDDAYTFVAAFPTGSAGQLLRYNTLGTALEFFTPSYLTSADILATTPLVWNSGTKTMSIPQATASVNGFLSSTDWLTFSSKQNAITLTTTGNSGASTLVGATLNVPEYTLAGLGGMANVFTSLGDLVYSNAAGAPIRRSGNTTTTKMFLSQTGDGTSSAAPQWEAITTTTLGAVPTTRTLTINGTTFDLSADRTFSVGTITSLTGEATASGTGAVAVTLTNSAVIGKVLTGLSISGGTIASTDSILTAFGKLQNQVNGLVGGVMYQGTWNASTNTPTLTSSVGTKGHYYVVSVAGSTNLDGVTDWKLGDWAIFNGSTWEKVDNTDSVVSVNGFTGAVSLTTANISEVTNLYYTDARSRAAISLTTTGSSGASTYSNTTGVLNIPNYTLSGLGGVPTTRTITINGTSFDLSADRTYSVGTVTSVALSVPTGLSVSGSPITSSGTLAISLQSGYSIPTNASQTNWDAAYNDKINSAAVTGTTTKTLTLTQQDGGTITASWTDINTDAVTSVFGRTGAVVAQSGDYTTAQVTESGNLYYLDSRARASLSFTAGSGAYNSTTGVITIPTNTNQLTNGANYITLTSLSAGTGISYNNTTGVISSTITQYTDALARAAISETVVGLDYNNTTGVFSTTSGYGIPTTASQTNWDTAYTNRITSLTTTGSSGAATLLSNTLNIPNYTLSGLGGVPTSRTITINDVVFDLSANRSWSVGDYGTW